MLCLALFFILLESPSVMTIFISSESSPVSSPTREFVVYSNCRSALSFGISTLCLFVLCSFVSLHLTGRPRLPKAVLLSIYHPSFRFFLPIVFLCATLCFLCSRFHRPSLCRMASFVSLGPRVFFVVVVHSLW